MRAGGCASLLVASVKGLAVAAVDQMGPFVWGIHLIWRAGDGSNAPVNSIFLWLFDGLQGRSGYWFLIEKNIISSRKDLGALEPAQYKSHVSLP